MKIFKKYFLFELDFFLVWHQTWLDLKQDKLHKGEINIIKHKNTCPHAMWKVAFAKSDES